MRVKHLILPLLILLPFRVGATVLFSDDFEISASTWDGRSQAVSAIDSESVGDWYELKYGTPSLGTNNYPYISSSYGYGGTKGFAFFFTSSTGTTQYFDIEDNGTVSQPNLFWGYRMKINYTTGVNHSLKLTRLTSGSSSIIPCLQDSGGDYGGSAGNQLTVYMADGFHWTGYHPDSNWHTYIWEFYRGTNNNDGIIRLYVDGTKIETWYTGNGNPEAINFNDSGLNFVRDNSWPNMCENLSGSYSGGNGSVYWDDYVWATTRAEVDAFLGLDEDPAPAPPTISNVTISNGRVQ